MAAAHVAEKVEVVICWNPFAGPAGDVGQGERVRVTDPRYASNPSAFVADGTMRQDWPSSFDAALERQRPEVQERERLARCENNRVLVPAPRLVKAKTDFAASWAGEDCVIQAGSIVAADHTLAVEFPGRFEPAQVR